MAGLVPHALFNTLNSINASQTRYLPIASGNLSPRSGEGAARIRWRTAVTMSKLRVRVSANATSASSTVVVRKNATDGNQNVTIGAGATGIFEDTTNTDSVSAGDYMAYRIIVGAGGALTVALLSVMVEKASGTVTRYTNTDTDIANANTTRVFSLCGNNDDVATGSESETQFEFEAAGTLKNLYAHVNLNTRTTDLTLGVRINGTDTSIVATIGAGATGEFEDTTNTEAVAVGDLVNLRATTGAGTGSVDFNQVSVEFEAATDIAQIIAAGANSGLTLTTGLTRYGNPVGRTALSATTESDAQFKSFQAMTLSNLKAHVSVNGITASTTVRLRVNGADGNQIITIGSGATGWFEDTTNNDEIDVDDLFDYVAATGGSGTSITFDSIGMLATLVTAAEPDAPTDLVLTVDSADAITLDWTDNSDDETGFEVSRAADLVLDGTVTTDGTEDVVGVGTAFLTDAPAGTRLRIGTSAVTYEVASVADDENLTLTATAAAQSAVEFSTHDAFSVIHTTAADAETYQNTGLDEQTRYWFQVNATNAAGDSDPTLAEVALTRGVPVVEIVSPPDGATITPGVAIVLEATAEDPDGYAFVDGDLEWTSDLDGLIGNGLTPSFELSSGTHEITFSATDEDLDVGEDSITVIVGTPSDAATVIRRPIMRYELLYGVAGTVDFWLSDADGNVIQPTLVAGDVKIAIDGGGAVNVNTLPTPNNSDGFTWSFTTGEVTGKRIKVMVKDQTVPAAWVAEPLYILTFGDALAFYTEEVLEVNSDGTAQVGGFSTAAKAELQTEAADALAAYDPPTFAELDARTDAIQTVVDAISLLVDTEVAAIKAKTDNLPSDPADQSLIIAATDAIFARLGAPVGASISADVAGVQSDTNDIQGRLPAALVSGRMDSSLAAAGLATDAVNEIRDAIFALTKDGLTFAQAVWLCAAVLVGKLSGGGSNNILIRDVSDTLNRVDADVDDVGNRDAVTLDLTGL